MNEFVKVLYALPFKWYPNESYQGRMLKRLINGAASTSASSHEVELDIEYFILLVSEEQEFTRPVLSMPREFNEIAKVDWAVAIHQLCASEVRNVEISNTVR